MVIYNRLGNHVSRFLLTDLLPDVNVNMTAFNINTSDRRFIDKLRRNKYKVNWRSSATEIDNHANTYFWSNFSPISLTSDECTVYPLLPKYTEHVNTQICTSVTALTLDSGEMVILEFVKVLWFVKKTEK